MLLFNPSAQNGPWSLSNSTEISGGELHFNYTALPEVTLLHFGIVYCI
jgi:hypothetical protein